MTNAKLISDYLPNFVKFIKSIDFKKPVKII